MVFQSTLPIQGETETLFKDSADKVFQSTLPIQGETRLHMYGERDREAFQSTLPIQGETRRLMFRNMLLIFQSTLPIQGETDTRGICQYGYEISIHSPYTGRDTCL